MERELNSKKQSREGFQEHAEFYADEIRQMI